MLYSAAELYEVFVLERAIGEFLKKSRALHTAKMSVPSINVESQYV
jgi:hypothetical protein